MLFLKRIAAVLCRQLVALAPNQFLKALLSNNPDLVVTKGARHRSSFRWDNADFKEALLHFEDLAFLFWNTPLNRGLLRQDFDEAATLFKTVRSLRNPHGVEIGRFHGASTVLLAVAAGSTGRVTSIDIAPQNDDELLRVLRRAGVADRVELITADANQVPWSEVLDFVFIDGDHSYDGARRDHNKWGKLVRVGGFIIHHDMAEQREFATQWSELKRLRENILEKQEQTLELVEEAGSMSVFRRKSTSWVDL
ncbi:MAG: class I SAM-dependent methyltransferase [Verrucomicrobia bacterium]|nr:class I SAM-dependent methyltransferase [Verrucomicrobiota bacterium]